MKMETKLKTGFKKTTFDGSEKLFSIGVTSNELPKSYSYQKYLPDVINQNDDPICVPCSISCFLNWRENLKNGVKRDNGIDYFEIYESKKSEGDGMTFKEALSYIKKEGVTSKLGKLKINTYGLVRNLYSLKCAIVMNGPCFGALPVYNEKKEFWKEGKNEYLLGYHAISIVGYDEEGIIIRNTWGTSFGDRGYTKLMYKDFNIFTEIWTILN